MVFVLLHGSEIGQNFEYRVHVATAASRCNTWKTTVRHLNQRRSTTAGKSNYKVNKSARGSNDCRNSSLYTCNGLPCMYSIADV